ncbi:Skg6p PWA37_002366 [Arxiozyma heterogenica]|uniref:Skg6p n=1 Tax=Arxiozyma heterogenica TaxID=278026 RepID=UPI002EE8C2AF
MLDTDTLRSTFITYSTIYKNAFRPTPTKVLVRRADSSSDNNSSASKTKNTKCTGSKQECELPANNKRTTSITVGVAVAVPVAFVAILLCIILYIIYKRSKKEEQEDNDPEFEGDSEYLPQHNTYEINHQLSSSDSNQYITEKNNHAFYNDMPMAPPSAAIQQYPHPMPNPFSNRNSSWTTDPFQLPETENVESLREFAKQVQNDGLGGYQLASRNGSQLSLHNRSMNMDQASLTSVNRMSNMRVITNHSGSANPVIITNGSTNGHIVSTFNSKNGSPLKDVSSINKNEEKNNFVNMDPEKLTFVQNVQPIDHEDEDNFDFEYRNDRDNITNDNNINNNHNNSNINQEKLSDKIDENKYEYTDRHRLDNEREYASTLPLSLEEENIQRMKSIYKVYLDKDENIYELTNKKVDDHEDMNNMNISSNVNPQEYNNRDFSNNLTSSIHDLSNSILENQNVNKSQVKIEGYDEQDVEHNKDNEYNDLNDNRISHRVASSIYSEIPSSAYIPTSSQLPVQQQQQCGYDYNSNIPMQQPQFYNNYPPLPNIPSQYVHPQTLEEIDELPIPAKLIHSNSSHSLTSFRQASKFQQPQSQLQLPGLQPARINGTAVNPMDHPEMFYSNNADEIYNGHFQQQPQYPNNSSMSFVSNNSQMSNIASPYQMRKCIVMTNPAELQVSTTFKPAGSIRNLGPQQQQGDPYTQHIHSRVSGILENNDMIQPPSMGGILPRSGSQEDLRKQLGSSNNYNIK